MEKINRSNVNSSQVKAQDFPKSGFDLSYKSRIDFILGRLHPTGYQYVMPADKFSGSNDSKITFNRLVVPEISDVEVSQHNFFVPFRSIDTTFIKGIVPTELNGMSSQWRVPSFKLNDITNHLINPFVTLIVQALDSSNPYAGDRDSWIVGVRSAGDIINTLAEMPWKNMYLHDYLSDIRSFIDSIAFDSTPVLKNDLYNLLIIAFKPLVGENSLLDLLGYNYLRDYDIRLLADNLSVQTDATSSAIFTYLYSNIDNVPQSEYAIRAYYSIWYEWYRDDNLEKRSATLPDWRDFGSTSIFNIQDMASSMPFLATRIRSWQKDMFVGSMPDDISRHVYAPILASSAIPVDLLAFNYQYENAEDPASVDPEYNHYVNAVSYDISYRNPTTGVHSVVKCPVPKAINDSLSTLSARTDTFDTFMLDLRDLRKSQMLERYLKRNFYFGDEYQDRMLAHYGSKVSDNSIRRPHLLSSSVDMVNPTQQVANVGTEQTPAGTRTAIASAQGGNDGYEFFAEEFGVVINILSVMPRAQYAGICPQNLLSQMTDFPLPEFANNNDEFGRVMEVATSGLAKSNVYDLGMFGHYPYAHAWRSRVDEVHGTWLSTKQNWTFRRFFGMDSDDGSPKLNYMFIHCRPNLGMFADSVRLYGQGYLTCDHHFYVERVLPTPVEEI